MTIGSPLAGVKKGWPPLRLWAVISHGDTTATPDPKVWRWDYADSTT